MACDLLHLNECVGDVVSSAVGDAINNMATAAAEFYGTAVSAAGTVWAYIGTPVLKGDSSGSVPSSPTAPAGSEAIATVLGYVMWICIAAAITSAIALGAVLWTRSRKGEGGALGGRAVMILGGTVLITASSALVSGLATTTPPSNAGGTVYFLQESLWWVSGAAAIVSVMIGGVAMAWQQRAQPGIDVMRSLLTLLVVSGAGVVIVGILVAASDAFSVWILGKALDCGEGGLITVDPGTGDTCFGRNMMVLIPLLSSNGLGALVVIILGVIAGLAALAQIVLMVARSGMLVILTGILPLSASFTNTEMGKAWFKRCIAWLTAAILYKPAAALVYAAAFQLSGANVFQKDGSGLVTIVTGLMLMVLALFALPALMRFVTPLVGATAGGAAGGALAAGAIAALPTGAAQVGRLAGGGSSGSSGAAGDPGPSGASRSSGTGTAAATPPAGAGAAASSGAGGAAAGGSAAAGGATAAGAAGGPVGMAAGAAVDVGMKAGQAATGAARSVGSEATGEGGR